MPRKPKSDLCAICGKEKATSNDHIPPRGIFAKPYPKNLITVPACSKCNNGASSNDEAFRAYLSLHVGADSPETQALWSENTLKTLQHNKKLKRQIIDSLKPVYLSTPSGIIYEQQIAALWDSKVHDPVVERTIRGLYYHHLKKVLGDKVTCHVQWLNGLTEELYDIFKNCPANNLGNDQVIYMYNAPENSLHSFWIFQFYKRHWASGYTTPVGESE